MHDERLGGGDPEGGGILRIRRDSLRRLGESALVGAVLLVEKRQGPVGAGSARVAMDELRQNVESALVAVQPAGESCGHQIGILIGGCALSGAQGGAERLLPVARLL